STLENSMLVVIWFSPPTHHAFLTQEKTTPFPPAPSWLSFSPPGRLLTPIVFHTYGFLNSGALDVFHSVSMKDMKFQDSYQSPAPVPITAFILAGQAIAGRLFYCSLDIHSAVLDGRVSDLDLNCKHHFSPALENIL
ncbi:hypothetical protein FOZ61_003064, partial [Perkinsus olseni]